MSRHVPALDGVRGLAVLAVMLLHFSLLPLDATPDGVVGRLLATGWIGVDLFFVLSGFLITGILADTKDDPRYFRNFYARRSLRIFPLYYAYLIALFVVLPAFSSAYAAEHAADDRRWWLWTYLGNVLMGARGWEGMPSHTTHLWSLAVEEQFYLVWPLLVYAVPRRHLAALCAAAVAVAWVTRTWLVVGAEAPAAAYVLTLARMDTLGVGGWLAIRLRERGTVHSGARLVAAGAALVLLGTVWNALRGEWQPLAPLAAGTQLFSYGGLALLGGALVLGAAQATPTGRLAALLTQPWLRSFGAYSYALYMFHVPLRNGARLVLERTGGLPAVGSTRLPAQLALTLCGIALSYGLAWLSWHVFEKRLLAFKRFFEPTRQPPPAEARHVVPQA